MSPWEEPEDLEPEGNTPAELRELVENQKTLLISVATGGPSIDNVDSDYKDRRSKLVRGLKRLSLDYPAPWRSLWDWYAYYKAEGLPSYASRRIHINERFNPLLDALEELDASAPLVDWDAKEAPPRDWAALEVRLNGLKDELTAATDLDGWQDVGRRAREIIKDAVNLVFEPSMVPAGEKVPQQDNAKDRLDHILNARFSGRSREETRGVLRKALRLAHKVTHGNITEIDAFAGAQATILVVRTLQRLAPTVPPADLPPEERHDSSGPPPPWDWDDLRPPPPDDDDPPPPPPSDDDVPF